MICVPDVASVEVLMVSVPGLPEGVTEFGLREQVEPLEPGTTQARDTAFVNPPIDTTFTAAVAEPPGTTVAGDGEAVAIWKSGLEELSTSSWTTAAREMFPDTPVIDTRKSPDGMFGVTIIVDVPEPPEIVVELSEQEKPLCMAQERVTSLLKPFSGLTTTVEPAGLPEITGDGENCVTDILKSGCPA